MPGGSLLITRPRAWFRAGVADSPSVVPVPGVGTFQGDYYFFFHQVARVRCGLGAYCERLNGVTGVEMVNRVMEAGMTVE